MTVTSTDPLVSFDDLRPGDLIRVMGDWHWICTIHHGCEELLVEDRYDRKHWYPVLLGETFLRAGEVA